ncbi:OmpA family protein [Leptolyngbya ohadii]|uniref:OmpA family protein n=1 Tax=Leptolyngbya ohadii TaxID=1962290 RepID=UPI000B59D8F2|nr:OmpA family protein [Leptolyngbya ohadii]
MTQSPSTSPSPTAEPMQSGSPSDVNVPLSSETEQTEAHTTTIAPKRRNRGSAFLWLFRLLLLGAGGSVAVVAGMAIAQFYPAQTQEMPFVERLLHSSDTVLRQLERLPQIWQGKPDAPAAVPSASPVESAASPSSTTDAASLPLTSADRVKLENELKQLQQELDQIGDRATALENRLGTPNRSSDIAQRLQTIQQQLNPGTATRPIAAPTNSPAAAIPPATSTVTQDDRLMVTLPSDTLFETDQTTLKPGTEAILNSIVNDLKQYSGATIRVTAHLDQQGTEAADRERSFQQAKAIEQYLGGQLKDGYHWLVEGYGHSRPVAANDTTVNRQRNRRIEIIIEPK